MHFSRARPTPTSALFSIFLPNQPKPGPSGTDMYMFWLKVPALSNILKFTTLSNMPGMAVPVEVQHAPIGAFKVSQRPRPCKQHVRPGGNQAHLPRVDVLVESARTVENAGQGRDGRRVPHPDRCVQVRRL